MVPSSLAKAGPYIATGTLGEEFAFSFPVLASTHIAVWENNELRLATGYDVTLTGVGGKVVFKEGYLPAAGSKVTILRSVPLTQETDLPDNTRLYPSVMETAFDKGMMVCQELMELVSRAIKVGPADDVIDFDELKALFQAAQAAAAFAATAASAAAAAQAAAEAAAAASAAALSALTARMDALEAQVGQLADRMEIL